MALLGALINVTVTIVAMRYVKMFVMKKSKFLSGSWYVLIGLFVCQNVHFV